MGRCLSRFMVVVAVIAMFAPLSIPSQARAAAPGPTIAANFVYIVQGNSDLYPGASDRDIAALRILSYDLLFNQSKVYADVPRDARNVTVVNLPLAAHGWEASGPMSGKFFIDVPANYPRNGTPFSHTEAAVEFLMGQMSDTNYSSGGLHLATNKTQGTVTSVGIPVPNCHNVTSANVSVYGQNLTGVASEISNDGGLHWVPAVGTSYAQFPVNGSEMKVRLNLTGNATLGGDPKITGFRVDAKLVAESIAFTAHISYLWTPVFVHGKALINITEPGPYSSHGSLVLMVYLVRGYTATAQGVGLRLDTSGTASDYPDKDLYYNMTAMSGSSGYVVVEITAPPAAPIPWTLYIGGAVIGVFLIGAFAAMRRGRSESLGSTRSSSGGLSSREDSRVESDGIAARRGELIQRKKEVMASIESVNEKRRSGTMADPDAKTQISGLKKELKGIRNELTKVSRRADRIPDSTTSSTGPSGEYENVLASLARIDHDFEAGRLPEATYKSVRNEYMGKAAKLKAELGSGQSPLLKEKSKLLEAIAELDSAHEKGEIDDKVYGDLSSSYKKELVAVMKRIDEGGG